MPESIVFLFLQKPARFPYPELRLVRIEPPCQSEFFDKSSQSIIPIPYSEDLRLCVVKAAESGKLIREVSAAYQASPTFLSKVHN